MADDNKPKKAIARSIDFSGVRDSGARFNKKRVKYGDYLAKIIAVADAEAKDKVPQYLFSIQLVKMPTAIYPYYCKLQDNQLWKLRNLFIAAGKVVPKQKVKVDPNQLVGKLIGVTMEDTEYDGKDQSEVAAVFPAADLGDEDNDADDGDSEEEEDVDVDGAADDDEEVESETEDDTDEEEEEVDPLADLNRTELKTRIKSYKGADWQASKKQTDDDLRELLRELESGSSDDEEEDEEEPEEEVPAPKKKSTPKKKVSADVSDDELEELDIDDI